MKESVELAALVFEDERCIMVWTALTKQESGAGTQSARARIEPDVAIVLLVVHAYREDDHGEEIIRIISARRAEKHEIRRYQEQAMD